MTKSELAARIAGDAKTTKAAADKAIDAIVAAITNDLAKGGRVALPGLGTFSVANRAERQGTNLRRGRKSPSRPARP